MTLPFEEVDYGVFDYLRDVVAILWREETGETLGFLLGTFVGVALWGWILCTNRGDAYYAAWQVELEQQRQRIREAEAEEERLQRIAQGQNELERLQTVDFLKRENRATVIRDAEELQNRLAGFDGEPTEIADGYDVHVRLACLEKTLQELQETIGHVGPKSARKRG
jgi:hypothetical protein